MLRTMKSGWTADAAASSRLVVPVSVNVEVMPAAYSRFLDVGLQPVAGHQTGLRREVEQAHDRGRHVRRWLADDGLICVFVQASMAAMIVAVLGCPPPGTGQ